MTIKDPIKREQARQTRLEGYRTGRIKKYWLGKKRDFSMFRGKNHWNYGKPTSDYQKMRAYEVSKDKTFEERFGKKKADQIKHNISIKMKNKPPNQTSFKKGHICLTSPIKLPYDILYLHELYLKGNSLETIGKICGCSRTTISHRFKENNLMVKPSGYGYRRCICKDGHIVRSDYEKKIDDFFYENNIVHKYEDLHVDKYTPDWHVNNDIIVEMWGIDKPFYNDRQKAKIACYKNKGFCVINIYPDDLSNLNLKLGFLIKEQKQVITFQS